MAEARGAGGDLDRWLAPFLDALGHQKRRTWAPLYLRGLLGPGERKRLQPMAARLGLPGHDQAPPARPDDAGGRRRGPPGAGDGRRGGAAHPGGPAPVRPGLRRPDRGLPPPAPAARSVAGPFGAGLMHIRATRSVVVGSGAAPDPPRPTPA